MARGAIAAATLLVLGATVFVLMGHEEHNNNLTIITEETGCAELPIHADWNDALNGVADTGDKCVKIRDEMVKQHDRFWSNVKCRLKRAFGKTKAASIEAAFTAEVDNLETKMSKLHCAQTVGAGAHDPSGCEPLRSKRLAAARRVKTKVEDMLLAKDPQFKLYLGNMSKQSKHLESRLARLDCAGVLASTPTHTATHKAKAVHTTAKAKAQHAKLRQAVAHHHKMMQVHEDQAKQLKRRVSALKKQLAVASGRLHNVQHTVDTEKHAREVGKQKLATAAAMRKQEQIQHRLQAKLKYEDTKIASQKSAIRHQQHTLAHTLKETEAQLKLRRVKIAAHRQKAHVLEKKIALVKWGEHQTMRLNGMAKPSHKAAKHKAAKHKAAPAVVPAKSSVLPKKHKAVPAAVPAKSSVAIAKALNKAQMPPVPGKGLDQTIGDAFEQDFNKLEQAPVTELDMTAKKLKLKSPSGTTAAKEGLSHGAPVSPKKLARALKSPQKRSKRAEKKKMTKRLAKKKPASKAAKATLDAVSAVKAKVRRAARAAAKKAAAKALKMGLSAAKTRVLVRAAAQAAARKTAKRAHRVFKAALANAPTPGMMAAARMRIAKKELAHKSVVKKERRKKQAKREAIESGNKTKRKAHSEQVFKRAAKRTVKAVAKNAKPNAKNIQGLAKGTVAVAQGIKNAETRALKAEAKAWVRAVGGATSKKNVLKGIKHLASKHKVSLTKAASRWEAKQVMKMRSRFARHFSKSLALNPSKKADRMKAQHQADRERINAQKMVIARAEMQEIVAKKRQERVAKKLMRAKNAGKRAKTQAAFALKKRIAQQKLEDSRANSVQRRAVAAVLAKDAAKAEKAEVEANRQRSAAKHATIAKEEALGALTVAQKKLTTLSAAAAKGTATLSAKLREQLKAQQVQMKGKIAQVKHDTAVAVAKKLSKVGKRVIAAKVAKAKARLALAASKKTHQAQQKAQKVAKAAISAAHSAKRLAMKESGIAAHARSHSKEIATKAVKRSAAVQSMAAQQMERVSKQKKLALKHFQEFNTRLRALENEKSAKTEAKIRAKQHEASRATKAAARAARFAEQQMAAADLQKSQAVINRADTANAVLQSAIYAVKTADARARGAASLEQEQQRVLQAKQRSLEKKQKALTKAKEQKAKVALEAVERKKKAVARAREVHAKKISNEVRQKHARTAHEGFVKGVAFAKEKRAKRDALDAKKDAAHAAERKAKALLKAKRARLDRALTPVQRAAKKLVKHAVKKTQASASPHTQAHHEIVAGTKKLRGMVAKVVAKSALTKKVAKASVKKSSAPKPKKHSQKVPKKASRTESIVKRAINAAEHAKDPHTGAGKATAHAIKAMVAQGGKK